MKALVKENKGKENVLIKEVDEPIPGKDDIKIKIHATGICGTDLHIIEDEYPSNYPVTMGHEYSGVVSEVGENVEGFKKGDRVISLTSVVSCGKCKYCYAGLLMLCEKRHSIGTGVNGAFAEYLVIPAKYAFIIPEEVSLDEAALSEPLACVVRSVIEIASVKAGDYVYVSGPGTIGQIAAQIATASGAQVAVAGTSVDMERLKLAKQMGAVETIVVDKDDPVAFTKEFTKGDGFDVAFECSGVEASADICLRVLKKTGQFLQVGLYGQKVKFDHDLALMKEISIKNSFASERTSWVRAIRLHEFKLINVKPLVSAKLPLTEWEKGFEMAKNKAGYKILLVP